jgi:hypothetical protein
MMGIAFAFARRATADKSFHPSYRLDPRKLWKFMARSSGAQAAVLPSKV